ncbi:MAG: response regulator receiver modulated metal dependent phosphohydrolase [Acidobacteriaceae bacterium]|nr:response regulator receiver modulated metal dependent phosphohydrolase [Acidobacteriaceae bacterium]
MPGERVLVVDDEEAVRSVVAALLERSGYLTVVASGAEEALQSLQQGPECDLILSDIMMPGTDGLTLLQRICVEHPGMPVVMISAVQDLHVATNAFRSGAVDYLVKPFTRSQLDAVVVRALEHGRLLKQNAAYRHNLEDLVASRTTQLRVAMEDLERSYDTTLEAMGDALDLRDEETEGHSKRVTAYTIALARTMGMSGESLKVIARGAFLHDLGKIAIPDSILRKPGRLDPEEMSIMREHCRHGYEMVYKISFLKDAAEIVHSHQERFDGQGYPRGLRGDEIPLGARIFALADTLDAMTSDRPYRNGTSFESARDEIARCAGGQFDPEIVSVFLRIPIQSWSALREEITRMSPAALPARLCRPTIAA